MITRDMVVVGVLHHQVVKLGIAGDLVKEPVFAAVEDASIADVGLE